MAAADRKSLEERRAAIASGELKGTPLAESESEIDESRAAGLRGDPRAP